MAGKELATGKQELGTGSSRFIYTQQVEKANTLSPQPRPSQKLSSTEDQVFKYLSLMEDISHSNYHMIGR